MLRIVLMGLLMRGDNHGYKLRKVIEKELTNLINVDNTSIYYTLNKLEEDGCVIHKSVSDSKRPQKNLYSLTKKGEFELKNLLIDNMNNNKRPLLNIDISLYFIDLLEPDEAIEHLSNRSKELRKLIYILKRSEKEARGKDPKSSEEVIYSHNRRLAQTELEFLKDLIESLKGK
ncbi:MAG: helix-turn-helix transcriptional regulator [Deltaproteobacteria bacterium]|uniref:Helix-turn-helix transcriptional regulator n=1 Tax=Candidatus Zymogenus saltonus TaxID=2844893 RepID=A0A9D8KDJ6_9DELT|nr:helix-turn-helix transcriptional regulator [Candidatus Zymogenus saltonus]